jgi:HAD superfamily hydrolase (TIGR01509 family)
MSAPGDRPFDASRPRPVATVLDMLRARIDHTRFDAALFTLESVAADLGYGDVRPLPGSIAWIDRLRSEGKRIALVASGERAPSALELAGIADRFDVVEAGPRDPVTLTETLAALGAEPARAVFVDVAPDGIAAARAADLQLAIAVARGPASPEALRQAGAHAVVADLQELLGAS